MGDQGAGQGDALPLAAAELVGVEPGEGRVQIHVFQDLRDPLADRCSRQLAVHLQGLADDVAHSHSGVEGALGILENRLNGAPVVPQVGA